MLIVAFTFPSNRGTAIRLQVTGSEAADVAIARLAEGVNHYRWQIAAADNVGATRTIVVSGEPTILDPHRHAAALAR